MSGEKWLVDEDALTYWYPLDCKGMDRIGAFRNDVTGRVLMPTDNITAGELRALGIEIAEDIPDVATIPRHTFVPRSCEMTHDEKTQIVSGVLTYDIVEAFHWFKTATANGVKEAEQGHRYDGVPNQVVVMERSWPPSEEIMGDMERVEGFTSIRVHLEQGSEAYRHNGTLRADDVIDSMGCPVYRNSDEYGVLYFIDQFPEATWAHLCTYVLVLVP